MAQWFVTYCPACDWVHQNPSVQREIPRYRVCSVDDPERWVIETNADLPRDVQEEFALLIADALSNLLGV
jgi:hypothetical protein